MCGGRSSRNEAELLIPKFSKKEDESVAPKYLLPHVFNAVAFERSAQNNSPIYSTMWRRIFFEAARKKQHEDPDVLTWCGMTEKSFTKSMTDHDTLERRCSTLWFASLAFSQHLLTMDDLEFHSDTKRLVEVCIIVRTLRRVLYRLIWQDCDISNLPFIQQDILRVTSRLFNQIHVREIRALVIRENMSLAHTLTLGINSRSKHTNTTGTQQSSSFL